MSDDGKRFKPAEPITQLYNRHPAGIRGGKELYSAKIYHPNKVHPGGCRRFSCFDRCRMRAPERIFEDFVTLRKKYNVKKISLWEEAAVPKCLKNLADRIKESDYDFTWFVEARLDKTFTKDFCRLLYEGGCRSITFGLESGNSRVQQLMNKGLNLEVCREVIRNCSRAKL